MEGRIVLKLSYIKWYHLLIKMIEARNTALSVTKVNQKRIKVKNVRILNIEKKDMVPWRYEINFTLSKWKVIRECLKWLSSEMAV